MLDKIEQKIEELPPLPDSVVKLEYLIDNDPENLKELTKIIEEDPFLTVDILKEANSPYYGFRAEITSVKRVVSLFGANVTRAFIFSYITRKTVKKELNAYGLTINSFMDYIRKKQLFTDIWTKKEFPGLEINSILRSIVFIEDIGKIILSDIAEEENIVEEMSQSIKEKQLPVERIEKEYLGYTTHEATYKILRRWKFSENIYDPIRLFDRITPNSQEQMAIYAQALRVINRSIEIDGNLNEKYAVMAAGKFGFQTGNMSETLKDYKKKLENIE